MLYFKEVRTAILLILYLRFNACQIVLASESTMCPSEVLMFGEREEGLRDASWVLFFLEGRRGSLFYMSYVYKQQINILETADSHPFWIINVAKTSAECHSINQQGTLKAIAHRVRNVRTLKNKYHFTLCQSRLHTASETFVRHKKSWISFDFLHFRIRNKHCDRKGWRIWEKKNRTQCARTLRMYDLLEKKLIVMLCCFVFG